MPTTKDIDARKLGNLPFPSEITEYKWVELNPPSTKSPSVGERLGSLFSRKQGPPPPPQTFELFSPQGLKTDLIATVHPPAIDRQQPYFIDQMTVIADESCRVLIKYETVRRGTKDPWAHRVIWEPTDQQPRRFKYVYISEDTTQNKIDKDGSVTTILVRPGYIQVEEDGGSWPSKLVVSTYSLNGRLQKDDTYTAGEKTKFERHRVYDEAGEVISETGAR